MAAESGSGLVSRARIGPAVPPWERQPTRGTTSLVEVAKLGRGSIGLVIRATPGKAMQGQQ
jgi:hypothetical protein